MDIRGSILRMCYYLSVEPGSLYLFIPLLPRCMQIKMGADNNACDITDSSEERLNYMFCFICIIDLPYS